MLDKKKYDMLNSLHYLHMGFNGYELGDDKKMYSDTIHKIIKFLKHNKLSLNLTDDIISDYHICLNNKYTKSYIRETIDRYYRHGSVGTIDYVHGLYTVFENVFKYENVDKTFNETLHIISLLILTHFGAISDYVNGYIIFKKVAYDPNNENNIKNKIKYICAMRDKKSHVREFIKLDRLTKGKNERKYF